MPDTSHALVVPPKYAVASCDGVSSRGQSAIHIARVYAGRRRTSSGSTSGAWVWVSTVGKMRKRSVGISESREGGPTRRFNWSWRRFGASR